MNTNLIKKAFVALIALICSASVLAQNEESKTLYIMKNSNVVFQSAVAEIDSIIFYKPPVIDVTGISLNKNAVSLVIGDEQTLTATVNPVNATDKAVTWTSSDETRVIVSADGKVTVIAAGTATITARAGDKTSSCIVTVKFKRLVYEDEVGVVINGVTWATRNVDAPGTFTEKPEIPGMLYQWNRAIGWSATAPEASDGSVWNASIPEATYTWTNNVCPEGWRVPNKEELLSLVNADSEGTTIKGINGLKIGSSSNTIFLPAAGMRDGSNGELYSAGMFGLYWSSTQYDSKNAYVLDFNDSNFLWQWFNYSERYNAYSVRCVADE